MSITVSGISIPETPVRFAARDVFAPRTVEERKR